MRPVPDQNRRTFLTSSALASLGLATIGDPLLLRADARPTPTVADAAEDHRVLIQMAPPPQTPIAPSGELKTITPQPYGPFYKQRAPFRGKLCPPGEPGTTFVLTGRVWGLDTRRPVPGAVLDVWHVDNHEKYSDGVTDFRNRGRIISSESGAYEFESIRPIPYRPNPGGDFWRCAHFHLLVVAPDYKPLVTEIHFKDDPRKNDPMYRAENAIAAQARTINGRSFETGVFDIVLERQA
jgi:protocatechuate 3,4-dioxygenase beta subunit